MSLLVCYSRKIAIGNAVFLLSMCGMISLVRVSRSITGHKKFESSSGAFSERLARKFQGYSSWGLSSSSTTKPGMSASLNDIDKCAPLFRDGHYVVTKGSDNVKKAITRRRIAGYETPVILVWRSQSFLESDSDRQLEFLLAGKCGGCQVTMDRTTLNKSVAVALFNLPGILEDLPDLKQRNSDQAYVFWSRETPSKTAWYKSTIADSAIDSMFNLTFYFRRDSDVIHYFGNRELSLRKSKEKERKGALKHILKKKRKLAVWVVSNCYGLHGATARMQYVKQMIKAGFKLDTFGACFDEPYEGPVAKGFQEYKFYLAFENSIHCPDYVTEKLWRNALDAGLVPVVFGPTKKDVAEVAPERSFIHIEDFQSPGDLVQYLTYLDFNNTAYMEYHDWRTTPVNNSIASEDIAKGHQASFCRLCKRQVLERHPSKTIKSVSKWLYQTKYVDDECLVPKDTLSDEEKDSLTRFGKVRQ